MLTMNDGASTFQSDWTLAGDEVQAPFIWTSRGGLFPPGFEWWQRKSLNLAFTIKVRYGKCNEKTPTGASF
jgi:hypothetical protein